MRFNLNLNHYAVAFVFVFLTSCTGSRTPDLKYDNHSLRIFGESPNAGANKETTEVNIAFSQWVTNQTGPCGCSMAPKGGIPGRAKWVNKFSQVQNHLVFDAGDGFSPEPTSAGKKITDDVILKNASLLADAYRDWKIDFVGLGTLERGDSRLPKYLADIKSRGLTVVSFMPGLGENVHPFRDADFGDLKLRFTVVAEQDLTDTAAAKSALVPERFNVVASDISDAQAHEFIKKTGLKTGLILGSKLTEGEWDPRQIEPGIWRLSGVTTNQEFGVVRLKITPLALSFQYAVVPIFEEGKIETPAKPTPKGHTSKRRGKH